jgi:hypothetical protein
MNEAIIRPAIATIFDADAEWVVGKVVRYVYPPMKYEIQLVGFGSWRLERYANIAVSVEEGKRYIKLFCDGSRDIPYREPPPKWFDEASQEWRWSWPIPSDMVVMDGKAWAMRNDRACENGSPNPPTK